MEKLNPKICIQTLDVAREKVRNFKLQLNKLLNDVTNGTINEAVTNEIQALINDFSANKYIISQNDRNLVLKLQELIDEPDKNNGFNEKQRSLSANISNKKNLLFNNNQNLTNIQNSNINNQNPSVFKSENEIIEESLSNNSNSPNSIKYNNIPKNDKYNKNRIIQLNNKIAPGHFSKLNKNYGENIGKVVDNQNPKNIYQGYSKQKSRDKIERIEKKFIFYLFFFLF